jgi:hypothetical protein
VGLDEQQAELGHRFRVLDDEHGADDLAVLFRDPAAFLLRVVPGDEPGYDARDQRLEALIPPVLLGVQRAVTVDDPAHVAGLVGAEHVRSPLLGMRAQQASMIRMASTRRAWSVAGNFPSIAPISSRERA